MESQEELEKRLNKHCDVQLQRLALLKNALVCIEAVQQVNIQKAAGLGDERADAIIWKAHTAASKAIAASDRLGAEEGDFYGD